MNSIIFKILKSLSLKILRKYHPKIVGITGSIGKTTTKTAISYILSRKFRLRSSEKNYNNEIGLPLTILGEEAPGKSLVKWLKLFLHFLQHSFVYERDYPEMLVLEMGADKPGDLNYLTSIVHPDVSVVTAVAPAHLEFFKNIENIAKEKATLVKNTRSSGVAILNEDDPLVSGMADSSPARVITFGFNDSARVKILNYEFIYPDLSDSLKQQTWGINFKIEYEGRVVPMFLPNALARHQLYSALAAISVGLYYDMNLVEISDALKNIPSTPGRLNLIPGIKKSLIIDDTYNSSPEACLAALEAAADLPLRSSRRWAVLGDMLELGKISADSHALIIDKATTLGYDRIVAVGPRMSQVVDQLIQDSSHGSSQKSPVLQTYTFPDSQSAADFLHKEVQSDDILLVKGSQGMRMEKIVKKIMAQPQKAHILLTRQYGKWLDN